MSAEILDFPDKTIRCWDVTEDTIRKMLFLFGIQDSAAIEAVVASARIAHIDVMTYECEIVDTSDVEAVIDQINSWAADRFLKMALRLAAAELMVYQDRGEIPHQLPPIIEFPRVKARGTLPKK